MTRQRLLSAGDVLKGAINEFFADNCPHLAAAISYYILLCLFPIVLAAISVFGFVIREPDVGARVVEAVTNFLPVSGGFVERTILSVSKNWSTAGIVATVGLIWAGMAVFNALRKSLNTAWGVRKPRPFLVERLMELLMMLGFGALMILSVGLTTVFKVIREANLPIFGDRFTDGSLPWQFAVMAISVFVSFLAFFFLYKLVPNIKVYWKHAAIAALVAAIAFEVVKNFFAWFVANFANYDIIYGSLGTVIALMIWAYVSAVVLLFCAKITSVYPKIKTALVADIPIEQSAPEKQRSPAPSPSRIITNMSSLTSDSVGALRRLMLGKG
ncbi:MAG: YihY/virulence factor BrkB family protein [Chloroflexota bacterium]|nr:YihY/virulence factor BrkB family protein [Chloroflexota bacterium]